MINHRNEVRATQTRIQMLIFSESKFTMDLDCMSMSEKPCWRHVVLVGGAWRPVHMIYRFLAYLK